MTDVRTHNTECNADGHILTTIRPAGVEGAALLELSLPEPALGEYAHLAGALGLAYASVPLPHSNFEARAWPKPSAVAAAAAALLDA